MFTKIVAGNELRKTRLHDEKGNFVGWYRLFLHGPLALFTGLLRLLFGYRVEQPWIAYDSIEVLRKHLNKQSRVLEYGSGMSTLWYAKHAGFVCSVEDCKPWFDVVDNKIRGGALGNISYQFARNDEEYSSCFLNDEQGFDLIMIDGSCRSACVHNSTKLLRAGGILYLDNSDKDSTERGGDMRHAEQFALEFAKERNGIATYVTDFAPTQLFVQQGLMIRLPIK